VKKQETQITKVQIRKATPEDAAFLAKAILIAGRAHVKKVYGK